MTRGLDADVRARLLARLRALPELGEADFAVGPRPLKGGRFSSVWDFELANAPRRWAGPLVLRVVDGGRQARLEAALQQGARSGGIAAPEVLLVDEVESGASLIVMERLAGRSYLRGVEPWRFAMDFPKLVTQWPRRFERVLGALRHVDVDAVRRVLAEHGLDEDETSTDRHLARVTAALSRDDAYGQLLEWLHSHAPPAPARPALVHGDLWPANVFTSPHLSLIDWTNAAIGDPALDVGFAKIGWRLMPQPFPPPPPIAQIAAAGGRSVARRISSRCDRLVGGPVRVRYYEALRCAVEIANVVDGEVADAPSGWASALPVLTRHVGRIMRNTGS